MSAELAGTEDLRALEDAAYYALSRKRRAAREFPVKETFFRLPSGSFAVGRTINWGTDSLGREGNYLTHHLSRDDLLAAGTHPLAVLEAAHLAVADTDLTPRALPPLAFPFGEAALAEPDFSGFEQANPELAASLAMAVLDGGEKTALLVGDEARARALLRALLAALAGEARLRLTFSTHFYEAHHLRSLFSLAAVKSIAEAPSQRQDYLIFDLDGGEFPQLSPASAYAGWLAGCLRARRWGEIAAFNGVLDGLRGGHDVRLNASLLAGARGCAALWERAGTGVARGVVGEARLVTEFLRQLPAPRPLADALLTGAGPSELCGVSATADEVNACLATLRSAATGKVWREWVKRWSDDPVLTPFTQSKPAWWQRWIPR